MNIVKNVNRLFHRKNLTKIAANISWLTFEKAINIIISLTVGVWFARYLGPEKYGTFNYAISIIMLVSIFSSLGLNEIVIREIVKSPEKKYLYVGTAFLLKFIGGGFAYLFSILIVSFVEPGNIILRLLVSIIGFQLIFQSFDVVELWFLSQVNVKKNVLAKSISLIFFCLAKVYLIIAKAPLMAFGYLTSGGVLLTAFALLTVYKNDGEEVSKWKASLPIARNLLKDSWPLIFAGLSVSVYMRIDQIMVGNMLGDYALGNYVIAVKLTEMWYFLPAAIVASVYPSIIKYKEISERLYLIRLQQLYHLLAWLAIVIAVATTFFSSLLIQILFGVQYNEASKILIIYIWTVIPAFLAVASNSYLMTENFTKIDFYRTITSALLNIILNFIMIPRIGLIGAALATLFSHSMTVVYLAFTNKTRHQFILIIKSFCFWLIKKESN